MDDPTDPARGEPMRFHASPAIRSAAEAAALWSVSVALAVAFFYATVTVRAPNPAVPALACGAVAGVTAGVAIWALVRRRVAGPAPVVGVARGAAVGVLAIAVTAAAHALYTFGDAGVLTSMLGQVGFACVVGGGPAAVLGAVFGWSLDRRFFGPRSPRHA